MIMTCYGMQRTVCNALCVTRKFLHLLERASLENLELGSVYKQQASQMDLVNCIPAELQVEANQVVRTTRRLEVTNMSTRQSLR